VPAPLDAILFDLGGTLDGRGGWRERCHRLITDAGVSCSRNAHATAFDYAESRTHSTPEMAALGIRDMVVRHVGWQLESLGCGASATASAIADRFVQDIQRATLDSRRVLLTLANRGFKQAVVSNACGNAALLCEEYGFGPALIGVVDSHVFGASKPDPAIFRHALRLLGTPAERTAFVGDSLDRDIEPAKSFGMQTIWIAGHRPRPAGAVADLVLDDITELPAAIDPGRTLVLERPSAMRYV
jgi:HAD superfamily hydrolase (TIGR01509 family)